MFIVFDIYLQEIIRKTFRVENHRCRLIYMKCCYLIAMLKPPYKCGNFISEGKKHFFTDARKVKSACLTEVSEAQHISQ